MLHELLLSLLGFTGDVIIEDAKKKTFRIKDGFDLLLQSEIDLINRIVPLGWYYNSLTAFVGRYDIGWGRTFAQFKKSSKSSSSDGGTSSAPVFHCYHTGMSSGIADLLEEYTNDISYLEQISLTDGPIPLGKLMQFVQKYLIVLPVVHRMCEEVESKVVRGCQILDYMTSYSSGIPIVNTVVQRIVLKIRAIFLKQCVTWMVHGELEDPGNEFFIYEKASSGQESKVASIVADRSGSDAQPGIHDEVMGKLMRAVGISSNNMSSQSSSSSSSRGKGFDWNTSYALRLEYVPETHVSPRMASKILFVGKAVRLLKSSASKGASKGASKELFEYLSAGYDGASPLEPAELEDAPSSGEKDLDAYRLHLDSCGYKPAEVEAIMNKFKEILRQPDFTVELLESLVDDINSTVSGKLWVLLRDAHKFTSCLQAVRSTYLMGKGELYQCLLDGVLGLTFAPTPDVKKQDTHLTWDVLRAAGKLLGLDEDIFSNIISLRVNNPSNSVTDFAASKKYIIMFGAAKVAKESSKLSLCSMDAIDRNVYFSYLWNFHFIKKASALHMSSTGALNHGQDVTHMETAIASDQESREKATGPLYSRGVLWFSDPKYVSKGFSLSLTAEFDWNFILSRLAASHAYLNNSNGEDLVLGTLVGSLHSERVAVDITGPDDACADLAGCVYAGLSLHALRNGDSISYYAKVFVKSRAPDSRFGRLSTDRSLAGSEVDRSVIWGRGSRTDFSRGSGAVTLAETVVEFSVNGSPVSGKYRSIRAPPSLALDIEYVRELVVPKDGRPSAGAVAYSLRVRVRDPQAQGGVKAWDIDAPLDLASHVKVAAGLSYVGVMGSGVILDEVETVDTSRDNMQALYSQIDRVRGGSRSLSITLSNVDYNGKGALSTYPVASPFTSTRFPDTFRRLEIELSQIKGWMNLKLEFEIPQIFKIVFDSDALSAYGRIFASLFKIKLVAHSLERLWKTRSRLAEDRAFCQIRHSMHYFISNLIYYLQVDVIDSEFSLLKEQISSASDFQAVLKSHRNFVSNTLRMSMVDNATVQEGVERILQVCLRFIALCRLLHQQEEGDVPPESVVVIPPEEVEAIKKDFFSQISYLFAVMRKIENRGFIFRLDFNSFFSQNIV